MKNIYQTPLKVEDYLRQVSYKDDPYYVPSDFALEFLTFIKLINGAQGEEHLSPTVHYKMLDTLVNKDSNVINMCARGLAKALTLDTPILTPIGYIPLKEIQVGDIIYDRNGQRTKVIALSEDFNKPVYEIQLSNGFKFKASEDHLHIVQRRTQKVIWPSKIKQNIWVEEVLSTKEILSKGVVKYRKVTEKSKGQDLYWYIPLCQNPIEFDSVDCPIDPYTLGIILGDGNIGKTSIRICSHRDDTKELQSYIPYETGEPYWDKRNPDTGSWIIKGLTILIQKHIGDRNTYTKQIPSWGLYSSIKDRISLLQGLMDTDGTISSNGIYSFTSSSIGLAEGVRHLVCSLGGYARISRHENNYAGYYQVHFNLTKINPFKLKRKAQYWWSDKQYKSGQRVGIESITLVSTEPTRCLKVDSPTESFLIETCLPTHNTTLLAEYLFLYIAVNGKLPGFGKIDYALYVGDSIDNAIKKMRLRLERRWTHSAFLRQYVPNTRFTDLRWSFTNIEGNEFIITGHGASTGVRGTVELNVRPQLAILDDLLSDEDAKSPAIIATIEDVVYKAVDYALHPSRNKIIWSGTPFNEKDPLYKAVESGAWAVNVYPVCEDFPCTKEEFRSAWPDRFTYEYVQSKYEKAVKSGRIDSFNAELMLRIMSDEDRLIEDQDIVWYSRKLVIQNKGAFNFYITTDFAMTESTSGDFSVISVWAYNNNGDWLWVDGSMKRQTMDKNIDKLFELVSEWNPQSVGIEISGQQVGFISWLQQEMISRNIYFNLASEPNSKTSGLRPTTRKIDRFEVVVPLFKSRKIWFPEELKDSDILQEGLAELKLVSPGQIRSRRDDFIDTVSMLARLKAWKPSQVSPKTVEKEYRGRYWLDQDDPVAESPLDRYVF